MSEFIEQYVQEALNNDGVSPSASQELFEIEDTLLPLLFHGASRIRDQFNGGEIKLCAIVNAKSGRCPEDCAFCAQSAHHKTRIDAYPLMSPREVLQKARKAAAMGAKHFSIVTSGTTVEGKDLKKVVETLLLLKKETGLSLCASLGIITRNTADRLKESGLSRYHHNLETAPSFFSKICTTHSYEDDLNTLKYAKKAGLEVCSGGIFGLGESPKQRLELAYTLKQAGINSVALNFLNPVPGTPLQKTEPLRPLELLKSVALFRFILPRKDIRICGGREYGLRDLHPLVFWAGANGIMIGDYLTTKGRDYQADLQMIRDLGLENAGE
ncbi:MAG: biotin synthase BioB [Deltaproteobacteria bacterium]|nr:biotin synthase BioB [Deltaproteobacteria bacterium]